MSAPEAAAAILWIGPTLYAVFGGADFGGGIWDLLARGKSGDAARVQIDRSLTPVWEANHVWLIFCLVVLWTAFPQAFAAIMSTLFIPLCLAAGGIVLRGAGFAFRKVIVDPAWQGRATRIFALSSLLTPFFMGTVVGAVAFERVPGSGDGDLFGSWLHPGPLAIGLLFVATSAYLAAVFLLVDSDRDLQPYFARRALAAALVAGAAAAAGLVVLSAGHNHVFDRLTGPALPLVLLSALAGLAALALLAAASRRATRGPALSRRGRFWLRPLAVAAVVAVIWAWGVAQYPYLLPISLTLSDAAAPSATLTAVFVVFAFAVVLILPALTLLYILAQRRTLNE